MTFIVVMAINGVLSVATMNTPCHICPPSSSPSSLLFPFSSSFPSFTSFSTYLPQHSWIQGIQFGHDGRPILCCTQWWSFCPSHMSRQSGKHLWCEWPIALICTPYLLTDISDAFATGFEEHMSTFSQEKLEGFEYCEDSCDGGSCV